MGFWGENNVWLILIFAETGLWHKANISALPEVD